MVFELFKSKNIPRRIFKTRGYVKQKLSKTLLYLAGHPIIIINLSFLKNAINPKLLEVRGLYSQDFHISMKLTTGKIF